MVRRSGHVCICWRQKPFARSTDRLAVQVAPFAAGIRNSVPLLIWIKLYFSGPPWPSPMWGRRLWQTGTRCLYFFAYIYNTWDMSCHVEWNPYRWDGSNANHLHDNTTSACDILEPWMIALTHTLAKYYIILLVLYIIYLYLYLYLFLKRVRFLFKFLIWFVLYHRQVGLNPSCMRADQPSIHLHHSIM